MTGRYDHDSWAQLGHAGDTGGRPSSNQPPEQGSYTVVTPAGSTLSNNPVSCPVCRNDLACANCQNPLSAADFSNSWASANQLANVGGWGPIKGTPSGQGTNSSGRTPKKAAKRARKLVKRQRYAAKFGFKMEREALAAGPDQFTIAAQLPELERRAEDTSRALAEVREHWRGLYHDDDLPDEARQELRGYIGRDQLAQSRVTTAKRRQEWLSANHPTPRIDEVDPWASRAGGFGFEPIEWDEDHPHPGREALGDGWDRGF